MKPFDIEKARAGHPVCYRDGSKPSDIFFLTKPLCSGECTVTVTENGGLKACYENGRYWLDEENSVYDLFLVGEEVKKEGWVAMDSNDQIVSFGIGSNKDEITRGFPEFKAVKITWEE